MSKPRASGRANQSTRAPLQQHGVDVAVVLVSDAGEPARIDESEAMVEFDGRGVLTVGDHRDHLPDPRGATGGEQVTQQFRATTLADRPGATYTESSTVARYAGLVFHGAQYA